MALVTRSDALVPSSFLLLGMASTLAMASTVRSVLDEPSEP